jgi:hypothetical protein
MTIKPSLRSWLGFMITCIGDLSGAYLGIMKLLSKHRSILWAWILLVLLSACSGQAPTQSIGAGPEPLDNVPLEQNIDSLEPPEDALEPAHGTASISGLVYSYTVNRVIPKTLYYLTPAVGENDDIIPALLIGPEEDNGDIKSETNRLGQIYLKDVPPGNYYIVVWAPYNWSIVENSPTEQVPRLIKLKEGDRQVLGNLFVSWP